MVFSFAILRAIYAYVGENWLSQFTVLGNIETHLTRNLCECILYFNGEICRIQENVPRFLKMPFIFLKNDI